MGAEIQCRAHWDGQADEGRALLETDALVFRGRRRISIPYKEMTAVSAEQGRLTVEHESGTAIFVLGDAAEKWAHRIRNPRSLIDKLGIKPGHRVVVLGVRDAGFVEQLRERAEKVSLRSAREADVILFAANEAADLDRLQDLKGYLKPNGALWVVRPKGGGSITEGDVMNEGKAAGLVDVKVVRFSDTHTAEKFVIPVAARP